MRYQGFALVGNTWMSRQTGLLDGRNHSELTASNSGEYAFPGNKSVVWLALSSTSYAVVE